MNIMRLIYYQISLLLFFFSPGPAETVYLSQSSWNSVNRKVGNLPNQAAWYAGNLGRSVRVIDGKLQLRGHLWPVMTYLTSNENAKISLNVGESIQMDYSYSFVTAPVSMRVVLSRTDSTKIRVTPGYQFLAGGDPGVRIDNDFSERGDVAFESLGYIMVISPENVVQTYNIKGPDLHTWVTGHGTVIPRFSPCESGWGIQPGDILKASFSITRTAPESIIFRYKLLDAQNRSIVDVWDNNLIISGADVVTDFDMAAFAAALTDDNALTIHSIQVTKFSGGK